MKNEKEVTEIEKSVPQTDETSTEGTSGESEFKLTVKKLEIPVRPRGVLAE